ncbi:hypothetical protein F441_22465 [Phytophthora nicotianae CJ01A1]|uniref:MULE transposase domain-containing protein n=1 Tax=Phytophthora nicotianae CJ01A1 TaxID=1317063 RepID=W2VR25_PHYNI|nr:hypothetical protein F441_22465 [Phytophthora nicotianae CJ01A1]
MDATFKLNQVAYPVIVCGVSDRCRVFTAVTGQQLLVKYVMADAEAGQQNAVNQVFGMDSDFVYLMCFCHVMAKVHEKLKGIPDSLCEGVVADIYDLHFASSKEVYDEQMQIVLERWSSQEQLAGFRSYFNNIWMKSEFWRWQCFHTPSGYATTNDPVEHLNRLIKRDYTLRTKHKIGTLLQLLADCCGHQSVTPRTFKEMPDASQKLKARDKDFHVVRVLSRGRHRVYLPKLGRSREVAPVSAQMGSNYARMETEGQPEGGWNVDVKHYTGLDGKRTLVNRSVSRKRRRTRTGSARVPAGRPRTNGHALTTD